MKENCFPQQQANSKILTAHCQTSSRKCKPISTHSTPLNATLPPPLPHQAQASPFKNLTDRKRVVLVYTFGRIKYFSYLEPYTKTIRCFDPSHIWLAVFFLIKYLVYVYTPMSARRGRSSLWTSVTGCWDCLTWVLGTADMRAPSPVPQRFLLLWAICLRSLFMLLGT